METKQKVLKPFQLLMSDDRADLYIYGDIVENEWFKNDASPTGLMAALKECNSDSINVHINSYGGTTSAGITIYNMLKNCGKTVTTIAEGFACSSASLIFCAGTKRVMRKASLLMIHNAWTGATGNAEEMRKVADDLEKISAVSSEIYTECTGMDAGKVKALMDAESWITPEEAVEMGFATEISEDDVQDAPAYSSVRDKVMQAVLAMAKAVEIPEAPELPENPAPEQEEKPEEPEETMPKEEIEAPVDETKTPFQRIFGNFK